MDLDSLRTTLFKWLPAFIIMMILLGIALFAVKSLVPNVQQYQVISDQVVNEGGVAGTLVAQENDPTNQVILKHQIDKLQENLNSAAVEFLTRSEAEQVLNRLYNYAYSRGVRVASLQAQASNAGSPNGAYDALMYQVQVGGGVSNLIDFLAHFKEASLPAVNILSLSALSKTDQATLTMMLQFYTSPFASGQALNGFPAPEPIPASPLPPSPTPSATPTEQVPAPTDAIPTVTLTPSPLPPSPTPTNTLTPTIALTPVMSPSPRSALIATDETVVCAGAAPTLFKTGDIAIVHFNGLGALRVLSDPNAPVTSTRTQAYDNQRLQIIAGPVCASQMYYWYIRNTSQGNALGWVAEGEGTERWLCPDTDPECTARGG